MNPRSLDPDRTRQLHAIARNVADVASLSLLEALETSSAASRDRLGEGWARLLRAEALYHRGNAEGCAATAWSARDLLEEAGDPSGALLAHELAARARVVSGDLEGALFELELAHERACEVSDPYVHGLILTNLASVRSLNGDPQGYLEGTLEAAEVWRAAGEPRRVAFCLVNAGGAHVGLGRLDEATAAYDEAEALLEAGAHAGTSALLQAGRAGLQAALGRTPEALDALARSDQHYAEAGHQVARQHRAVASAFLMADAPDQALGVATDGLARVGESAAPESRAALLEIAAAAHEALGDLPSALAALRAAAVLREKQRRATLASRRVVFRSNRQVEDARRQAARLERLAHHDALTGLYNRAYLSGAGARAVADAREHALPLCVVLLDLDRFKSINDTHGHAVGDAVLRAFADTLAGTVRDSDFCVRLGGEEFCVVLPGADATVGRHVAERVLELVRAAEVPIDGGSVRFTVSAGVATLAPEDTTLEALLKRADALLYDAKRSGRDRVAIAPASRRSPSIALPAERE